MSDLVFQLINGAPWAITPEMLSEIHRIYEDHRAGRTPDIAAIEAQLGRSLKNEQKDYEIIDGVAVISVVGVIAKRMNLFMEISGGISIEKLTSDIKSAITDPLVRAIVLVVDSPGGSVDGIFELADLIYSARDMKPVVSLAYGTMASAAYLIGAAASAVYASDIATVVGSIGVVATHKDTSERDAKSGVVTTEIYRGKYKRIVTDGPLTEEGRMNMMEKVDYYFSLFVNEIARFRGVSADRVLTAMSTEVKDFFIGQQAVDAGLIDGIATLDSVINLALSEGARIKKSGGITASGKEKGMADLIITTIEQLAAAYPDLTAAVREQGARSVDLEGAKAEASANATQSEKERILGLAAVHFGTEEGDKFSGIVNTGVTVEQLKAIRGSEPEGRAVSDEDRKRDEMLQALKGSGAPPVGSGADAQAGEGKDYMTLVKEYQAQQKCTMTEAMKEITAKYPQKQKEYIKKANQDR